MKQQVKDINHIYSLEKTEIRQLGNHWRTHGEIKKV